MEAETGKREWVEQRHGKGVVGGGDMEREWMEAETRKWEWLERRQGKENG